MGFIKDILSKISCCHEWRVHAETKTFDSSHSNTYGYPYKIEQTLVCKKCGKIKRIKI